MCRISLIALAWVSLVAGCDGGIADTPADAETGDAAVDAEVAPRDRPHWAIVGVRYDGAETESPQSAPPARVLDVPAEQPLSFIAITEMYDYCAGEGGIGTVPCCVASVSPEAVVEDDEIVLIVGVGLSAEIPCNGNLGPEEFAIEVGPLAEGRYRVVALGREELARPDFEFELDVR